MSHSRRRVEYEADKRGKWRWREVAGNGLITATSGQGYTRLDSAREAYERHRIETILGPSQVVIDRKEK